MPYKFANERADYADLSSGRVFHSLPGYPAFPIRLASEIFQRCVALRGESAPCVLYDPCCGAGYLLAVLAWLHGDMIAEVVGSDVDAKAVALAMQNLGLLHPAGLDGRISQIEEMLSQYGKTSHAEALSSAQHLREQALARTAPSVHVFQANALDANVLGEHFSHRLADIVITDVPYGQHSQWQETASMSASSPVSVLLGALTGVLSPGGIVAIASDKQQKGSHERYRRLDHFQIGKRRVVILKLVV